LKRLLFIAILFLSAQSFGQEKLTRILFILDASNSMNALWGGTESRIDAAKDLLAKTVDSLRGTPNLEIALRVYGHQSPITATYQDCNDTKLEVPFGVNNFDNIKIRIRSIEAKGTTPIARSLEAAAADFPDQNARNIIILITDGQEACDNDPCVIAKKLHDKGVKVTPFVIGLGLDISYLEKFNCIGAYSEAETKDAFRNVLSNIVSKVLTNTTVQINLNDSNKQPKETEVTMFLYEAGTKNLKYTFIHTINRFGNPDTLIIDPNLKYDLVVNTIPLLEKKNISIQKNTHNTIVVDAPQGYIKVRFINATKPYQIDARIMLKGNPTTLNVQKMNVSDKYITGKYDVEILTLPRTYTSVDVTQSSTSYIDIPAPGTLNCKSINTVIAQVFVLRDGGVIEWVCNLDEVSKSTLTQLQPGSYRVVYRQKNMRSSMYTLQKDFRINSNKTTTLNL
jgi:Ca-activated chloride channel family protein